MATAVATDSRRRFSKRRHVTDIKNITGDDQATLMVDRNSAISCIPSDVLEIATDTPWLLVAFGDLSNGT